ASRGSLGLHGFCFSPSSLLSSLLHISMLTVFPIIRPELGQLTRFYRKLTQNQLNFSQYLAFQLKFARIREFVLKSPPLGVLCHSALRAFSRISAVKPFLISLFRKFVEIRAIGVELPVYGQMHLFL